MNVNQYLDSTYLKTPEQAGISEKETEQKVVDLVNEAIENNFKLVMIRPNFVSMAKKMITDANADVVVGTVIGFHEGTASVEDKLKEAQEAIDNGVDELDYVVNYTAFKNEQINLVKAEVFKGTKIGLENGKIVKWIIEIAALSNEEIVALTQLIRDVVLDNFSEEEATQVFVKSSTGFFKREDGGPVGATFEGMELIVENAKPLQAKAAGGVRSYEDAVKMIEMGVTRIGTSSAKKIADGKTATGGY
ncbi:deoxyribose-phosphate aldolase [Aureivirga marina]|uniref:deoxyribose-phosphate aldolase n=1 Tax=Aureivirga marina TaxID=1182451 RepID=UPI0018CB9907|nr:deoxyribose-phosphate aldolase [Aureivirga marina]